MTATKQTAAARSRLARHVRNLVDFGDAFDEQVRADFSGLPEPPAGWTPEQLLRGTCEQLETRVRRLRMINMHIFGGELEKFAAACQHLDVPLA